MITLKHLQNQIDYPSGLAEDINGWFRRDSYVSSTQKLLLEIEKVKPDVVVLDLGLYEKSDGIETSRMIRSRFDVPVMYV